MRNILNGIGKYKLYFLRGYQGYFALLLSLFNSTIIIYKLLLEDFSILPSWIRYSYFAIIFISVLIIIGIIIGKFDMKRGTFNQEQETFAEHSPIWQRIFKQLDTIEGYLDEQEMKNFVYSAGLETLKRLEKEEKELEKEEKT